MFINIQDILNHTIGVIRTMTFLDYIEILIITALVYILIRFVRETRAEQLLKGIFVIIIVSILFRELEFKVLGVFSETIINVGVIAAIVTFQPELRRVLERMGRTQIVKSLTTINFDNEPYRNSGSIDVIAKSCERLSRTATGALIVIERETKLGEQIGTGTILNAFPSEELLENIFYPLAPLHDGAVIVRDGIVLAAGCFLPKPQKEELISKDLGSRHRAAIGMSEVSDAVIIVVSEETGTISIAQEGELIRGFDCDRLHKHLSDAILPAPKRKPKYKNPTAENNAAVGDNTNETQSESQANTRVKPTRSKSKSKKK